MPTIREITGYIVAVGCFTLLHMVLILASNQMDASAVDNATSWLNSIALMLYAITGFIASRISKRRPVVNGLIAGLLAATTASVLFGFAALDPLGKAITLFIGTALGAAGGAISLLVVRNEE